MASILNKFRRKMGRSSNQSVTGFTLNSRVLLVVRDGRTGKIKDVREGFNDKVLNTYNLIATINGHTASYTGTINAIELASGANNASSDTALSGATMGGQGRTRARMSHNANEASWTLSASFTAATVSYSVGQAGIFQGTATVTVPGGGAMYLKATFARLAVSSQDVVNLVWTQSLASA